MRQVKKQKETYASQAQDAGPKTTPEECCNGSRKADPAPAPRTRTANQPGRNRLKAAILPIKRLVKGVV
jgi:hypothetical protein